MPGFLDNLEDYLAILRSADVSALAGNVLLAVSDRRGMIRGGWSRKPTHILLKGFALKLSHDGRTANADVPEEGEIWTEATVP